MGFLKSCFCIPRTVESGYKDNRYEYNDSDSPVHVSIVRLLACRAPVVTRFGFRVPPQVPTPHPQGAIDAPLVEAAEAGEQMTVKALLRQGVDTNQRAQVHTASFSTFFHLSCTTCVGHDLIWVSCRTQVRNALPGDELA